MRNLPSDVLVYSKTVIVGIIKRQEADKTFSTMDSSCLIESAALNICVILILMLCIFKLGVKASRLSISMLYLSPYVALLVT